MSGYQVTLQRYAPWRCDSRQPQSTLKETVQAMVLPYRRRGRVAQGTQTMETMVVGHLDHWTQLVPLPQRPAVVQEWQLVGQNSDLMQRRTMNHVDVKYERQTLCLPTLPL